MLLVLVGSFGSLVSKCSVVPPLGSRLWKVTSCSVVVIVFNDSFCLLVVSFGR